MNLRQLFQQHLAPTSPAPMNLEMVKAEGVFLWDAAGKRYIDLIAGFSVSNIGHSHPAVVKAVQEQAATYMHLMVYGELIQSPVVAYARRLTSLLPSSLDCIYFTNSGAEAAEGAMKLAKRITGRSKMIAFEHAYHGSTQGALSLMGDEYWRRSYRPLLPDIYHYPFGAAEVIAAIDHSTACVVLETVQAESGVTAPDAVWLQQVREKCTATGTLLILDEIQAGFGRTGTLWAFEQMGIVPDVLLLGKALGGGMPLGAFIASRQLMHQLSYQPVLGHITTFGGHPVSCAAGLAALEVLLQSGAIDQAKAKEKFMRAYIQHPAITEVRTAGCWMSLQFASAELNQRIVHQCVKNGLLTDWFIFAPDRLRIAPPLTIENEVLKDACDLLLQSIDEVLAS
ncbi:MAG: aspartate aminotransferase family protein [Bacteroidota bacterium]|jgi:acetylornithine/N-succinyldiaminopimelate aminotransferase